MQGLVADYIEKKGEGWKHEVLVQLRDVLLECDVEESIKWGSPTYSNQGNVVSFVAFKNHIALWFFQGVFLTDPAGVLIAPSENTEGMRQWRFKEGDRLDHALIKSYIDEAIANSIAGKKISPKATSQQDEVPEEFAEYLEQSPIAKENFEKFSVAKRNEFIRHIASAKQMETRIRRMEKAIETLEMGLELHHKYKK